jgi:hypothetical protein
MSDSEDLESANLQPSWSLEPSEGSSLLPAKSGGAFVEEGTFRYALQPLYESFAIHMHYMIRNANSWQTDLVLSSNATNQ